MMRGATIVWAVLATVAGTGLFLLKYQVQAQEQRLSGLHKQINGDQEAIHVLKAEWSYLNDPGRLREQAAFFFVGKAPYGVSAGIGSDDEALLPSPL